MNIRDIIFDTPITDRSAQEVLQRRENGKGTSPGTVDLPSKFVDWEDGTRENAVIISFFASNSTAVKRAAWLLDFIEADDTRLKAIQGTKFLVNDRNAFGLYAVSDSIRFPWRSQPFDATTVQFATGEIVTWRDLKWALV